MPALRCDVAILGGGPAGGATALRLRRHDPALSVVLVEASGFEVERIGETVPPAVRPLLEGLGVWDRFREQGHVEAYGMTSTWGGEPPVDDDFITSPFGRGWHLDRKRFDAMLTDEAARRGVRVLGRTRVTGATRSDGWRLDLEGPSGPRRIGARWVVDATGRRSFLARHRGARRAPADRLVGLCGFFRLAEEGVFDRRLLLEPVENGWWYVTALTPTRALAVLITDSDLARKSRLTGTARWREALAATRHARRRVAAAKIEGEVRLVPASSGRLDRMAGDGWLAVGDAAASFDPLSGQGIAMALESGSWAAYAVADALKGRRGCERYRHKMEAAFDEYLDTRAVFYGRERRWSRAPFWRRRHDRITLAPDEVLAPAAHPPPGDPYAWPLMPAQTAELLALCDRPKPAHRILSELKPRLSPAPSDRRLVLALQSLIETGAVSRATA